MTLFAVFFLSLLQSPPAPALPTEWTMLPEVELRGGVSGLSFEDALPVSAMPRQCRFRRFSDGMRGIRVESALLVDAAGRLIDVVPDRRACQPLRRYLARLYPARLAGRLVGRPGEASAWYRIATTFSWSD